MKTWAAPRRLLVGARQATSRPVKSKRARAPAAVAYRSWPPW